jgi:hypothetical protein
MKAVKIVTWISAVLVVLSLTAVGLEHIQIKKLKEKIANLEYGADNCISASDVQEMISTSCLDTADVQKIIGDTIKWDSLGKTASVVRHEQEMHAKKAKKTAVASPKINTTRTNNDPPPAPRQETQRQTLPPAAEVSGGLVGSGAIFTPPVVQYESLIKGDAGIYPNQMGNVCFFISKAFCDFPLVDRVKTPIPRFGTVDGSLMTPIKVGSADYYIFETEERAVAWQYHEFAVFIGYDPTWDYPKFLPHEAWKIYESNPDRYANFKLMIENHVVTKNGIGEGKNEGRAFRFQMKLLN